MSRFQLFHDVILRLGSNDQAKQQMINACRHYYRGNEKELKLIDKFERSYTNKECIRWYTRETFVYKMVNKALRGEDIQQLHTFRFIINDLSSTLAREYNQMLQESDNEMSMTVYRGGQITITELEQFQSNEGKLISINGYLSTSRLRNIAMRFTEYDVPRMKSVPVLFEIKCEMKESNCSIFADISKFSDFPNEQEVLFDLGSVFKVEAVYEDDMCKESMRGAPATLAPQRHFFSRSRSNSNQSQNSLDVSPSPIPTSPSTSAPSPSLRLAPTPASIQGASVVGDELSLGSKDPGSIFRHTIWKICLSTTDDGREIARQYIEETKKEMQEDSVAILFGRLMIRMGRYDSAQTYFQHLLNEPGNENLANIHNQLGLTLQAKAEFRQAMRHFDKAYDLMKRSRTPCLRESALVLLNMSQELRQQGYYEKALEYCILAKQELNDSYQLEIAHCLHSIGSSYRGLRKYTEALEYYKEALNIKQSCLPENHVYIAKTLNSIAIIYLITKDIEKAFNFSLSSFEMYEKCLPNDHPDIANVLHTIAECYQNKSQFDNALQHYQLALAMKEKYFPPDHPSIATTLNNISTVLSSKGEKMKALDMCLKALSMRERALPFDHPDIAVSLSSVGLQYEAMEDNQHALEYFEKALEMRTLFLSEDDPARKRIEKHVLRIKRKLM